MTEHEVSSFEVAFQVLVVLGEFFLRMVDHLLTDVCARYQDGPPGG